MKSTSQSTPIVVLILLIAASLFGLNKYSLPQLKSEVQSAQTAGAKVDGVDADITILRNAKSELTAAKSVLEQQGVSFNSLSAHIPKTEELPSLYRQVQQTLKEAVGISNASYQIGVPVLDPSTSLARIPFTISANGSYANLKAFSKSLTVDVRPLTISQMSFITAAKGANPDQFTLSLTGVFNAQSLSNSFAVPVK